jgi:hypothetical protein
MFCNSRKIKAIVLLVGVVLIAGVSIQGQDSVTAGHPTGSITLLDSTRERDGLIGSVRRVKVQTAKLETKSGQPIEGPLQLLEITTYSLSGKRIENVSYPVANSSAGKEEYKYDDKGNIVEMTLRGDDGSILSREKYDYELDTFGNWTKMVTSLVVFEDGQLKVEPVEVTYRTLAYYFNDTVAQIVDSASRPGVTPPAAPTGVAISNAVGLEIPSNQLTLRGDTAAVTPAVSTPDDRSAEAPARTVNEPENSPPKVSVVDPPSIATNDSAAEPKNVAAGVSDAEPKNIDPKVSAGLKRAFEYYKTGRERFDSGAIKEAVDAYRQSLELAPESPETHLSLGHAYLRLKQNQQALKSFKQATLLNPEMAEAHYGLGLSYFNLRRNKDAANAFKQATVVRPDLAKAHFGLALAYQELGNEDAVVTEFRILETLDRGLAKKLADTFPEFNLPCRVSFCK